MGADKNAEVVTEAAGGWGEAGFGLIQYSCFYCYYVEKLRTVFCITYSLN